MKKELRVAELKSLRVEKRRNVTTDTISIPELKNPTTHELVRWRIYVW